MANSVDSDQTVLEGCTAKAWLDCATSMLNLDLDCPHMLKMHFIMKTYLYNFDPLKAHFYIVKLGFTGVYIIFLISA